LQQRQIHALAAAAAKPAGIQPAEVDKFDLSKLGPQLQETQARMSSLAEKHRQIDAQRHLQLQGSISAGKHISPPMLWAGLACSRTSPAQKTLLSSPAMQCQ
jgi:hypothetical protein